MAVVDGALWVLDGEEGALHQYRYDETAGWAPHQHHALVTSAAVERVAARRNRNVVELLMSGDSRMLGGRLPVIPASAPPAPASMAGAAPLRETQPVEFHGDAADDPAIWIHPVTPSLSRVIGTNKQQGLLVYDLDGRMLQSLPVGRLNNVDVRAGIALGQRRVDLAVASHRDRNSLSLFAIDRDSGVLTPAGDIATPLSDIYGLCLYQPSPDLLYAFVNDKDGTFLQYRIDGVTGTLHGELVRQFATESQPEGCVADDLTHRLYLGEEDFGVSVVDARADQKAKPEAIIKVGAVLKDDVEGLALYHNAKHHWLIVSSQGNDSYVVLEAAPPYRVVGQFRVVLNADVGIDGASETDGLEVTSINLGPLWPSGMLVVQDGRNRMPEQPQNFKLIPWAAVEKALASPSLSP